MKDQTRHRLTMLTISLLSIVACTSESTLEQRQRHARSGDGPIKIGVVWSASSDADLFQEGLELAVDEINASGGMLGRRLALEPLDDEDSVDGARRAAQTLADDPSVLFVVGHRVSYLSEAAAPTYVFSGQLLLAPAAFEPPQGTESAGMILRNMPSPETFAAVLAEAAQTRGYRSLLLFYADSIDGRRFANAIEDAFREGRIELEDRRSFDVSAAPDPSEGALAAWEEFGEADALVLVGTMPHVASVIRSIRQAGLDMPILGTSDLDHPALGALAGEAARDVAFPSIFDADSEAAASRAFVESFRRRYDREPDTWAAQGYDIVKLIAAAVARANSAVPGDVAEALRELEAQPAVTGELHFEKDGTVRGKRIVWKTIHKGAS